MTHLIQHMHLVHGEAFRASSGKVSRSLLLQVIIVCLGVVRLAGQTAGRVDPGFNTTSIGLSRGVEAVAVQADAKVVVVGGRKGLARLNADGTLDASFAPSVSGYIRTIVIQSDGKMVVGGYSIQVNGVARNNLARLNADGSLDASFALSVSGNGTPLNINAIVVQSDGKLVVGGDFNQVNGVARDGIARLNADGTLDAGFAPSVSGSGTVYINAIVVQSDGKVVVGGGFTQVNGVARNNLARLNADGSLDASFAPNTPYTVTKLCGQADGILFVSSRLSGSALGGVVRLNADGSLNASFAAGAADSDIVTLSAQSDGKVLLGGNFTQVNGVARAGIARLNADGTLDSGFAPSVSGGTYSSVSYTIINSFAKSVVVQADGRILFGGFFTQVNGQPRNSIARVTNSGELDGEFLADVAFGPNSSVGPVVVQSDGKVVVGGRFTQVNGVERVGIARLNADGTLDSGFAPNLNDYVNSVVLQSDGKIVLGGAFTQVNGVARVGIARLNADGTLDSGFVPSSNISNILEVDALFVESDGKVLLAANFNEGMTKLHYHVLRLNADGSLDTSFTGTRGDPAVSSLAVQADGKTLLGGYFSQVNGTFRSRIARLNANGTLDTGFAPSTNAGVLIDGIYTIVVQSDGKVVVGGGFTQVNGVARNNLARLNADGTLDASFAPSVSGYIRTIVIQSDGKMVVGGGFTQVNGVARNNLARLNADGTLDTGFAPNTDDEVGAVVIQTNGKIYLSGSFAQVNGLTRNYVARLNTNGSLDQSFIPGAGATSLVGLSLQPDDGKVVIGGAFSSAGGQFINALARLLPDGNLDRTYKPPFVPGDKVQALQRQPSSGLIFASALPAGSTTTPFAPGSGSVNNSLSRGAASALAVESTDNDGLPPRASSKVGNPIKCCLDPDGSFNPAFKADAGTDDLALCLGLQVGSGKLVVAGRFQHLNPSTVGEGDTVHANLGRLLPDGHVDTAFAASADLPVRALAIQAADDRLVVGGDFTQVNGAANARLHLARLNADGSLDGTFRAAQGIDGSVTALLVQSDNKIVLGGGFTQVQGAARGHLARVDASGNLDVTFTPGAFTTTNGDPVTVASVVQQPLDGKLIVAGRFDVIGTTTRHNRVRLNPDGSVDAAYGDDTGGPDALVRALALQPDGKALLGGDFTTVDALERAGAARLLGDAFTSLPGVAQWRFLNFGTLDPNDPVAGNLAAPYGDGVSNLLKFALNLNPAAADATLMTAAGTKGLPLAGRDPNNAQLLSLTFVRRTAASNPGITYTVEFADALGSSPAAFAANPNANTAAAPIGSDNVWERVIVTDSVPAGARPRRFVRLKVSSP